MLIANVGKTALPTEKSGAEGHMLVLCLGHYLGAWSDALLLFHNVASGGSTLQGPNHAYTQQWMSTLKQWEAGAESALQGR